MTTQTVNQATITPIIPTDKVEVAKFLMDYTGTFPFVLSVKKQLYSTKGTLTATQWTSAEKCMKHEQRPKKASTGPRKAFRKKVGRHTITPDTTNVKAPAPQPTVHTPAVKTFKSTPTANLDLFSYDEETNSLSAEVSSVSLHSNVIGGEPSIILVSPETGNRVEFTLLSIFTDVDNDVQYWRYHAYINNRILQLTIWND